MLPTGRDMILVGDFNSIIDKRDSTNQNKTNRASATLICGCDLRDVWDTTQNQKGYILYAHKAVSRMDRIYVTARLHTRKSGVERVAAWFTDHLEVVLRMAIDAPLSLRGRSYWRMNYSLLQIEAFEKEIDDQWRT
jgi:endonuclease/exonuclease/phosphatase family metal-dependent hydrolase